MKTILLLLASLTVLTTIQAQDTEKKYKAEVIRSAAASVVDDKGLSTGTVQLIKGAVYPVLKQNLADVVLDVNGQSVRVNKNDVNISEGETKGGFIRIISAKYGFAGEQQFEVKEEIKKRLPSNPLTEPVKILVSDKLLRSKAGLMVRTTMVNGRAVVVNRTDAILTITYEYDGERKVKEVMEGKNLVLP